MALMEKKTASRRRRSGQEVRGLILGAARSIFAERGFAGATTRQIADRAGVVEPLLFRHFGNKSVLFEEAVIAPFNSLFTDLAAGRQTLPPDPAGRGAHFVHHLYGFLRDNGDLLHALVKSGGDHDGGGPHGLDAYFTQAADEMRARYEERGYAADVPPEFVVRYSFGLLAAAVLFEGWFFPGQAPDDAMAEHALTTMLNKATAPRSPS